MKVSKEKGLSRMANSDTRVEDLLNSLVGCAFLVMLVETGISPEDLVDPKVSLRMAAGAADSVDRFNSDHGLLVAELPTLAREKAGEARAVIEHPGNAWWFDDIDLNAQAWLSIHGTLNKFIYGTPPDPIAWRRPQNPSSRWERYAQKPYSNQITSTQYGPHLTSALIAYDERVGDYLCEFPLAWWSVRFLEEVRVFEIHGSSDWHNLCVRYPAEDGQGQLVPNWGAAAEEWDGVHLSLGGLLTAEQNRYESLAGWTMLDFWHAEQTYWLRALKTETKRQPDFERGMGAPEIQGLDFPDEIQRLRFPDNDDGMLTLRSFI